jgi:hypothetical protein
VVVVAFDAARRHFDVHEMPLRRSPKGWQARPLRRLPIGPAEDVPGYYLYADLLHASHGGEA